MTNSNGVRDGLRRWMTNSRACQMTNSNDGLCYSNDEHARLHLRAEFAPPEHKSACASTAVVHMVLPSQLKLAPNLAGYILISW